MTRLLITLFAVGCSALHAFDGTIRDFVHAVHINATVADGNGCVYLVGYGQVQPTSGVAQPTYGGGHYDAIVAKWSADGRELIYAMNLGGGDDEAAQAIAVDASGNAYVAGFTYSPDFPTSPGAFQSKNRNPGDRFYNSLAGYFPGGDVFVSKISADGKSFLFSSLAGGTSDEAASAIAVDVAGNAYVTGYTRSADFPVTARAWRINITPADKGDASFIFKLNATGTALSYSTFFDPVRPYGISVDLAGNVYICGTAFQPVLTPAGDESLSWGGGTTDAFVSSLDASGESLRYSKYLGGSYEDSGQAIQVDSAGHAWVTGWSWSTDFPVKRPIQSQLAGLACPDINGGGPYGAQPCGDAFLSELSATGDALLYSTYFGGAGGSAGLGLQLDRSGNVWMAGAGSLPFVTQNPWLAGRCNNGMDQSSAIAEFGPAGDLLYATYASSTLSVLDPAGTVRTLDGSGLADIFSAHAMRLSCVVNGATFGAFVSTPLLLDRYDGSKDAGILAPGEIVSIFGGGLGPNAGASAAPVTPLPAQLAGVRVLFNGIPGPLLYVQNSQINAVVPYGIAGTDTASVVVEYNGQKSPALTFLIDESSPGVFSLNSAGVGQAAVLNQDGSVNSPGNAAAKGSVVSIFATGGGLTSPRATDGSLNASAAGKLELPVTVRFSEPIDAEILYAGPAPGLVSGAIQINARIPPQTASGNRVPIYLKVGRALSDGEVSIAVR
jgi:uncharacterized protein (TIGR03437 family)